MSSWGQLALLLALIASGYAAFACTVGGQRSHRGVVRTGVWAAAICALALTAAGLLLAYALLVKDFRFAYVAQYTDRRLPWYYALSSFWVGQAGSLLLWSWLAAVAALVYRSFSRREPGRLREIGFGILAANTFFLVACMVFGADPLEPSLAPGAEGAGLGPVLQHPAMLLHPPVVFAGYVLWAIPFALSVAALVTGRLDASWIREVRSWALVAWAVSGVGILLGANWAYEELGWGGYWAWDPVENGSLIPWLTGTALLHAFMAWQYRGMLKKTAILLSIATCGFCNLASFVTRSGVFQSLHAFGQSPLGWMFLAWMAALGAGGAILVVLRRGRLAPQNPFASVWSREALVVMACVALLLLVAVALGGTFSEPLSEIFFGQKITVGAAWYNSVLIPVGLLLLAITAAAPLLCWGAAPSPAQQRLLFLAALAAAAAVSIALAAGLRHPISLAIAGLATAAAVALVSALILAARRHERPRWWIAFLHGLAKDRRQNAGFLMHVGFVCLAVGVTGSTLGTRRHEAVMSEGETIEWAGRSIRLAGLTQQELPDKIVVAAHLEIAQGGGAYHLLPAQHLHLLQNEWRSVVAIHSTWGGDFYTVLNSGQGREKASLTFVVNPLMRWLWAAGWIAAIGTLIRLWPTGRPRPAQAASAPPSRASRFQRKRELAAGLTGRR